MDCEKCGASVDEGGDRCPECGEPVGPAASGTPATDEGKPGAPAPDGLADPDSDPAVPASDEASVTGESEAPGSAGMPAPPGPGPADAEEDRRNPVALVVGVAVAAVLLAVVGWLVFSRVSAANSPEAAASKMMAAYAAYDAQGILDVSTHENLKPEDIKTFAKQAADAKKRSGGRPGVKDVTIGKVTSSSDTTVTVEVTGQWLADETKGTYEKRTEKLTVVKPAGTWLVLLF